MCVSSTMDGVCHRLLWFENDAVSPCVFYRRFPGCSFTRSCTWNFQISITLMSRIWPVPLRTASNDDRFSCILAGDLIDRGAVRRQTSCIGNDMLCYVASSIRPNRACIGYKRQVLFPSTGNRITALCWFEHAWCCVVSSSIAGPHALSILSVEDTEQK